MLLFSFTAMVRKLCPGAAPTPPPSVNFETAVTSITYTKTVENYRCLWNNFVAPPVTNHSLPCHCAVSTRLTERLFRRKTRHVHGIHVTSPLLNLHRKEHRMLFRHPNSAPAKVAWPPHVNSPGPLAD